MARAIWKGAISFGLVHIPVELYSAESRHGLDLDMLDKRDFAPIGYKRYNKETGKDIDWNDIVKGYEYEKGQYVVLSDEDLKRANVEAMQTIDIIGFVDAAEIPVIYYEQPYYLAPSRGGDKVYVLLRETLKRAGKVGIAKVVIRTKQHIAALLPMERVIVLDLMRYHNEIRGIEELNLPDAKSKSAVVSDKEIKMALSLLQDMIETWQPEQYHDTYYDDVMALVEKKIHANQTKTVAEPEAGTAPRQSAKVLDLMELLKKSIGQKGRKGPAAGEDIEEEEAPTPRKKATATPIRKKAATRPAAKTASKSAANSTATPPAKSARAPRSAAR